MKTPVKLLLLVLSGILISSCARIYLSEDAYELIDKQKVIAVAPSKTMSSTDYGFYPGLNKRQRINSIIYQEEIYNWIRNKKDKSDYTINLLPLDSTYLQMKESGFYNEQVFSPKEICDILNVDALIMSTIIMDGGLLNSTKDIQNFGDYSNTTNSTALMEIYDRKSNKVIWYYDHRFQRGLERSYKAFVEDLMINSIDKIPYFITNK